MNKNISLLMIMLSFLIMQSCRILPYTKSSRIDYNELQKRLLLVHQKDQRVRFVYDSVHAENLTDRRYYNDMKTTDSLNQIEVLSVLDTYGWIPQSKIGEPAAKGLFFVIQHSNHKVIKKYLPLMEKMAERGEANALQAAAMRDRLLMFEGKKQLYGTQAADWVRKDGKPVIWPIKHASKVDKLRKQIGFKSSVVESAAKMGVPYDPKEKLPKSPPPFLNN